MIKVHIDCTICSSKFTRQMRPGQKTVHCTTCGAKRKLVYFNKKEARAERYNAEEYPERKVPKTIQTQVHAKEQEKTVTEAAQVQPEQSSTNLLDSEVENVIVEERIVENSPALSNPNTGAPAYAEVLKEEHVAMLAQAPFELIAHFTKYDGWRLTDRERKELAANPAVRRTFNKYLAQFIGKYPDEYMCLTILAITIMAKGREFNEYKKQQASQKGTQNSNPSGAGNAQTSGAGAA